MSKEGYKNLRIFWGPQEEKNYPKSIGITGKCDGKLLAWFPGLGGILKFNLEIPYEKFPKS